MTPLISAIVCYTVCNMTPLLLIGIVLMAVPLLLMIGFAAYIFWGFMNDDKDARNVLNVGFVIMGLGLLLILGHVAGTVIQITP
jgi:flagellar basal body-associated protein FliL